MRVAHLALSIGLAVTGCAKKTPPQSPNNATPPMSQAASPAPAGGSADKSAPQSRTTGDPREGGQ